MTEWRTINDLPYSVSDEGHVRNDRTGRILKPMLQGRVNSKYEAVALYVDGERIVRKVHHLVAAAFLGPSKLPAVRHLDDDRSNNAASNLAYGTQGDNLRDAVRNGTHAWASRTACAHGHEYTTENTRYDAKGARVCRACALNADRRHKARLRLAS